MQTPLQELIGLIPDAVQIKQFISETDADEKMLDEWLWEQLYKGRFWIEREKQMVIDAFNAGYRDGEVQEYNPKNDVSQFDDAINYYNGKHQMSLL